MKRTNQKGKRLRRLATSVRKHNWTERYLLGTENVAQMNCVQWLRISWYFCLSGKKEIG